MALFVLRAGYSVESTATGGRVVHTRTKDALELSAAEVQILARAAAGGVEPNEPGVRPIVKKLAGLGLLEASQLAPKAEGAEPAAPAPEALRPMRAEETVPSLRADLRLERASRGQVTVRDPATGRSVTLHEFEVSLARMLNGRRTVADVLVGALRLGIPASLESLTQFVRQLRGYGFLAPASSPVPKSLQGTTWEPRAKWDDGSRVLFQTGLRLARRGRRAEAARYFEALLTKDPTNQQARKWLEELGEEESASPSSGVAPPRANWLESPDSGRSAEPGGAGAFAGAASKAPSQGGREVAPTSEDADLDPVLFEQESPTPAAREGAARELPESQSEWVTDAVDGALAPGEQEHSAAAALPSDGSAGDRDAARLFSEHELEVPVFESLNPLPPTETPGGGELMPEPRPRDAVAGGSSGVELLPGAPQEGASPEASCEVDLLGEAPQKADSPEDSGEAELLVEPPEETAAPGASGEVEGLVDAPQETDAAAASGEAELLVEVPREGAAADGFGDGELLVESPDETAAPGASGEVEVLVDAPQETDAAADSGEAELLVEVPREGASGDGELLVEPPETAVPDAPGEVEVLVEAPQVTTRPETSGDGGLLVEPPPEDAAPQTSSPAERSEQPLEDPPPETMELLPQPQIREPAPADSGAPAAFEKSPSKQPAPAVAQTRLLELDLQADLEAAVAPTQPQLPGLEGPLPGSLPIQGLFDSDPEPAEPASSPIDPSTISTLVGIPAPSIDAEAEARADSPATALKVLEEPAALEASAPSLGAAPPEPLPESDLEALLSSRPVASTRARRTLALGLGAAVAAAAAAIAAAWHLGLLSPASAQKSTATAKIESETAAAPDRTLASVPQESAPQGATASIESAAQAQLAMPAQAAPAADTTPAAEEAAQAAGPAEDSAPKVEVAAPSEAAAPAGPNPAEAAAPKDEPARASPAAAADASDLAKLREGGAPEGERRWSPARIVRRGRVTMGEIRAAAAGAVIWLAKPQQRIRAGQAVGRFHADKAADDPEGGPGQTLVLKAPKSGLFRPAAADRARCKPGDKLASVVYHEAYLIALATAIRPGEEWECRLSDDQLHQREPCHVVTVAAAAGGWSVTATTAALWIDSAPAPRLELAPPEEAEAKR
jgi:hypothetical protein